MLTIWFDRNVNRVWARNRLNICLPPVILATSGLPSCKKKILDSNPVTFLVLDLHEF